MPKQFTDCQKGGGKIRTKTLSGTKYAHVCISKGGKSTLGEIKTKKGS